VRSGALSKAEEDKAKLGTKAGKAQDFLCTLTGTPITRTYIQGEGKADRLGNRLLAIVAEGPRGRVYLPATAEHEAVAKMADQLPVVADARSTFLSGSTPTRAMVTGGVCSAYGLRTWGHLFTSRQLVALTTLCDLVNEARQKVVADARANGMANGPRLPEGGSGAEAYADAVAIALAMALSRHLQFGSTQSTWYVKDQAVKGLPQQALPMVWDYCEANPFGDSSANIGNCTSIAADCIAAAPCLGWSKIEQKPAQATAGMKGHAIIVSTDPPYYDNVGYADLADFFHAWLRRALREIMPTQSATLATPKTEELVATTYRDHGDRDPDEFWLD
jgi:putative DNA methylase